MTSDIEKKLSDVVLEEIKEKYPIINVKESFELYKKLVTLKKDYNKDLLKTVEDKVNEYLSNQGSSKIGIIVDKSKATKTLDMHVTPFPEGSRLNPDYKKKK